MIPGAVLMVTPKQMLYPYQPPPFIGTWSQVGRGKKKPQKREKVF